MSLYIFFGNVNGYFAQEFLLLIVVDHCHAPCLKSVSVMFLFGRKKVCVNWVLGRSYKVGLVVKGEGREGNVVGSIPS